MVWLRGAGGAQGKAGYLNIHLNIHVKPSSQYVVMFFIWKTLVLLIAGIYL